MDDATGSLYVAEEQAGLWRYDLDPATGDRRTAIDHVGDGGHLTADVEGITLVRGSDGTGQLMVSSQGDSTVAIYDLDGEHTYRGSFTVTGTDGLDAATGDFGPDFPHGLLVVHDEDNRDPGGGEEPASNLKILHLDRVVRLAP